MPAEILHFLIYALIIKYQTEPILRKHRKQGKPKEKKHHHDPSAIDSRHRAAHLNEQRARLSKKERKKLSPRTTKLNSSIGRRERERETLLSRLPDKSLERRTYIRIYTKRKHEAEKKKTRKLQRR